MFLFLQGNRSAKLKQSKLDVRREQWLSQGLISRAPYLFFFFFVFPIMFDFGCCWVGPGDLGVWGGGGIGILGFNLPSNSVHCIGGVCLKRAILFLL